MGATVSYFLMLQKYINSNISGDFSGNDMKKKTGVNGCVQDFPVDDRAFNTSNIIDIQKYLLKKHDIK